MRKHTALSSAISLTLLATLAACGGGGGSSASTTPPTQPPSQAVGPLTVLLSDASAQDWATIGVKILSISLTPSGGGTPVAIYSAAATPPSVNLVQLDQLSEILGNATIPTGTYTAATLTLSANPGDVTLTASASPDTGFAGTPGATVPSSAIDIQHASGSSGAQVVQLSVNLTTPLVVTASGSNALDLEFDLSHPAFIIAHVPVGGGATRWAVNFNGPVHQRPLASLRDRILRHSYGNVSSVSSDGSTIAIAKLLPSLPITDSETAVATGQSLTINIDTTNGTIFYDVDAKTKSVLTSFAGLAGSLPSKYVRVAARYQQDGTLVATRVWASSSFESVWLSPEGHLLNVDQSADTITVTTETGSRVVVGVDQNTQFFKRETGSDASDSTPIGTGTAFLANLVAGFKVHISLDDPLAAQPVAQTVEIETAAFSGRVSAADTSGFAYTRTFRNPANNYSRVLPFISATSVNGTDDAGNPILGFKWWNFAYPTLITDGSAAISSFVALSSGTVDFGGTLGTIRTYGASYARWNDSANPNGWSAPWVVVEPAPLPLAAVTTPLSGANTFTMTALAGVNPVTVAISTAVGSATLAYQVDRTNDVVTVSPLDLTNATDLATFTADLVAGAPVRAGGVPTPAGTVQAYTVEVYTGTVVAQ